jgi:hypothetical protein
MKYNFKQIFALGTSALLIGMTAMAGVGAANYPAPFVVSGNANVAVVYGTGSGVAATDQAQATLVASGLMGLVSGTTTTVTGESYLFEKTSTKFHLGDTITGVISTSLDEDELPNLLADGKFIDSSNDEFDFTQKITMEALQLTMFEDNDYREDDPSIGIKIGSGTSVLTYLLDFSDEPLLANLETTELVFMGTSYYVLTQSYATGSQVLTLLDSASEGVVSEGATTTLTVEGTSYAVSIEYIASGEVKLNINGEVTNSLAESETQKLADGAFVGIKDIMFDVKEAGISKVELSIGSGKLKLTNGAELQLNDDTVSGLDVTITNTSTKLSSISLAWATDDDEFVTEDSEVVMPAFGAVKLSFNGLSYPFEELIEIKQGGDTYLTLENFPLKDGSADIDLIYGVSADKTFNGLGKDSTNKLITGVSGTAANITFDKDTDDYFIASWSDNSDAESYLMRATSFTTESSVDKATIQFYDGDTGVWVDKKTGVQVDDTFSIGSVDLKVWWVNNTYNNISIGSNSANTHFNKLYSKEGMTIYLPFENSTADSETGAVYASDTAACAARPYTVGELYTGVLTYNDTSTSTTTTTGCPSFVLKMVEEDKNGNKAGSSGTAGTDYDEINVTLGWDASTTAEVEVSSYAMSNTDAASTEILDTDIWRDFTYSALATEFLFNKPSSGQKSLKLVYHGDEVAASVLIAESGAVVTGGTGIDSILVTDAEVSTVQSKNLVVIGGSCINSVAATLVGGSLCTTSWTTATEVGTGQFLIKSYANPYATGKVALLVAGYEREDTVNAATYLRNIGVDTTVGKTYIGTTATQATLQVA